MPMRGACHVAVGEDDEGVPFMAFATSTHFWKLDIFEARALAAQITRVADTYEKWFKTEVIAKWEPARKP